MQEAIDRRDSGGADPAFYAFRALESTIKIISDKKGWTHGKEKGAHNFIENLSKTSSNYIEPWEGEALKFMFTQIRNPISHGAGSGSIPRLNARQSDWAIESCMIWIKSLVRRL